MRISLFKSTNCKGVQPLVWVHVHILVALPLNVAFTHDPALSRFVHNVLISHGNLILKYALTNRNDDKTDEQ